jgi:signal transduction histidine kinase
MNDIVWFVNGFAPSSLPLAQIAVEAAWTVAVLAAAACALLAVVLHRRHRRVELALRERLAVLELTSSWLRDEAEHRKQEGQSHLGVRQELEEQVKHRADVLAETVKALRKEALDRAWAHRSLQDTRDQLKKTEEELAAARAAHDQRVLELRAMAVELTLVEQRQRRRLAEALHDGLQQTLLAARLRLEKLQRNLPDAAARRLLDEIQEALAQAISECRTLTMETCPPVLDDAGLVPALEWLARHTETTYGLPVELQADAAADPSDKTLRDLFFQAVRELLVHVVKHARADRAWVSLCRADEGMFRIEVRDNGHGDGPAALQAPGQTAGHGPGIADIRQRVELLGGRVEIETAPAKGTRVAILLPTTCAAVARENISQTTSRQ